SHPDTFPGMQTPLWRPSRSASELLCYFTTNGTTVRKSEDCIRKKYIPGRNVDASKKYRSNPVANAPEKRVLTFRPCTSTISSQPVDAFGEVISIQVMAPAGFGNSRSEISALRS